MGNRASRFIALGLATLIALTGCVSNSSDFIITGQAAASTSTAKKEGKYPTAWDLTILYKSEKEFNEDYEKAKSLLAQIEDFKGTLNTAENINEYFQFVEFSEFKELTSKMEVYADMGTYLNPSDSKFQEMCAKIITLDAEKNKATAFADPEICSMSLADRKKIFSDPIFKGKEYRYRKYTDPNFKCLTEDEKKVVATLSIGQDYALNIYNIFYNIENPNPMITMPDGTEQELTTQLYEDIVHSKDYDDSLKEQANKILLTREKGYINTYAALLEEKCKQAYAMAQLEGFDSTIDKAFYDTDISTDVFYMLVDAAHEGCSDFQRYLELHKKGLGLEKQYAYNMATPVSDFDPGKKEYDDAVDEVIDSLSVLGTDYTDLFKKIITSDQVDVYPTSTKSSIQFMSQEYKNELPWVFLNYNGHPDSISAIAHEMGHACYGEFSTENQPAEFNEPSIFTHEVASITNEIIHYNYMIEHSKDNEEKLYYLEELITLYSNTFFYQMMYSEFEDYLYKTVESGSSIDAEAASDKWAEIFKTFRGDKIISFPDSKYRWTTIPHFYYVYYVYQYAADITYANYIAGRINSGEKGAVDEYMEFLKSGSSASPADLLKKTGVDPLSKSTYDEMLKTYKSLVDEYEELVNAKIKK
ncbi:M3 family metallopeptidase [Butyrivibrio sp. XPD2002]|uniref:M3 family metallopeptidase n=1 Tax=Butyrivibrio sp. XPD2002 TaxID=1280665 RepID=UPI0004044D5B|nr:M3 family metallopeptidase [Butyrivibrio sp. XPD2002]